MPHRKPELQQIIKDLGHFINTTCKYDPKDSRRGHDFVSEKCNDAFFMLQEAHDELDGKVKEEKI